MAKKIFVENEELQATVDALSVVDGTVELMLGVRAAGENVLCLASSISTGGEQIQAQFAAIKPSDYVDGYLTGTFNGKELLGILRGVLALKDRVYFEQSDKGWFIGVKKDVRLPISTLAQTPNKIAFNNNEQAFQVQVAMSSFVDALRGGSFMTAFKEDDRGLSNAVIRVIPSAAIPQEPEEGKERVPSVSGTFGVFSTDSYATSKASVSCAILNAGTMDVKGCKVAFPKKAALNLCKLLAGKDGTAALAVDKTHVMVAIGKRIMYAFTQGAKYHDVVFKTEDWDKANKPIVYVLDNEDLKQKIGLLTSVADLKGSNSPIRFVMEEGKDLLIQLCGSDAEVRMSPVSSKMEGKASVCLSGKKVSDVLSLLKKGNVRISFLEKGEKAAAMPVGFSNGDLSGNADNSVVSFLLPVKDKAEEPKKEETVADADSTAATEE